jgi:hypothetical protein
MYYPYPDFWQQLEQRLRELEENNLRLNKENQQLKQKIENIKPIHIENINYKVQELVVRELSGTLNIGMTGLGDPQEVNKWLSEHNNNDGDEITLHDLEQTQGQQHPGEDDDNFIHNQVGEGEG